MAGMPESYHTIVAVHHGIRSYLAALFQDSFEVRHPSFPKKWRSNAKNSDLDNMLGILSH